MKTIKELQELISKEEFNKLYVLNLHSYKDIAALYDTTERQIEKLNSIYKCKRSKEQINAIRQSTMLKKYGIINISQSSDIKKKKEETCLKNYGCRNPSQSDSIRRKKEETCLLHYGVKHAMQSDTIKTKTKNTLLEKTGYEYPMQNPETLAKNHETHIKKYGYKTVLQDPQRRADIINKMNDTIKNKYGCTPVDILNNSALHGNDSTYNNNFAKLLDNNKINYTREFVIDTKRYDFLSNKTCIEIDPYATHNSTWGIYNENGISKIYHKEKSELAEKNGYTCIHIFDWDDANKVVSMLLPKQKVYARKCDLKSVSKHDCDSFLNAYHIQSSCKGQTYAYGIFYKDELIELITFGKPRYNKKYDYELLRLCTKPGYIVVGGASKLFNHFINEINPNSIISYCDRSKFSGDVYKQLGFTKLNSNKPSKHWYNPKTKEHYTDNVIRKHGFSQIINHKNAKDDENYGTTDNSILLKSIGFVEIFDCGQDTWEYKKTEI